MKNPFETWSLKRFLIVIAVLAVATFLIAGAIKRSDEPLAKSCTPNSAALEWISDPGIARQVATDWQNAGLADVVTRGILIDFLFIIVYSTYLAIACFGCALLLPQDYRWRLVGVRLGWAMWLAGLFDVIENIGILLELHAHAFALAPLTATFAIAKWTLVAIGVLYIVLTLAFRLRVRNFRKRNGGVADKFAERKLFLGMSRV